MEDIFSVAVEMGRHGNACGCPSVLDYSIASLPTDRARVIGEQAGQRLGSATGCFVDRLPTAGNVRDQVGRNNEIRPRGDRSRRRRRLIIGSNIEMDLNAFGGEGGRDVLQRLE